MRALLVFILLAGAAGLAALTYYSPLFVAGWEVLTAGEWPQAALSQRRMVLVARGAGIAAAAAVLATLLGAGLAAGLVQPSRLRPLIAWAAAAVLLTPPYIYTYAWSLVILQGGVITSEQLGTNLVAWLAGPVRAAWCLATWLSPVAAVVLASGWRSAGRGSYTLALLDAAPARAAVRAAAPAMLPWILLAVLLVGPLALTEYSVCHLCLVQTWNTEVLAEAQLLGRPGNVSLLAWPLIAVVGLVALGLWPLRRALRESLQSLAAAEPADEAASAATRRPAAVVSLLTALVLLLPVVIMAAQMESPASLLRMWNVFRPAEWGLALLCALGAGMAALWLAVALDYLLGRPLSRRRPGPLFLRGAARVTRVVAVVFLVLPPAVVGDAFLAAYVRVPAVLDHAWAVSLVGAARYAAVAVLLLHLSAGGQSRWVLEQAASDGASWAQTYLHVRLPLLGRTMLWALAAVGLLSLTEVAASQMVSPSGVANLALTMLNQIHFGRNDDVIALCLYVMALVACVTGLVMLAGGRRRSADRS